MSLRTKFLALLVGIPSICLALFLHFAITTFVQDKTTYLLESQAQLLSSARLFFADDAGIVPKATPPGPAGDQAGALPGEATVEAGAVVPQPSAKPEVQQTFLEKVKAIARQEGFESLLVMGLDGRIEYSAQSDAIGRLASEILGETIVNRLKDQLITEGSFEITGKGGDELLVSFMQVRNDDKARVLILSQSKAGATRASLIFLLKALSTFVALSTLAVIISVVFSTKLTKGILQLSSAMKAFGQGNVDAPLPAKQNDEVGRMTELFGEMRNQIRDLMSAQQEKTKIETEMKLAGDLQRRFFPDEYFRTNEVELLGFFEPAAEAGGDWWFYFLKDRTLVFLIGDVTGHGLNAAMITGVSRAIFSQVEQGFNGPGESLGQLNRGICDTAHGELNMTCVICALDIDTGVIRFSNASHEIPIVIPAKDGKIRRNEFSVPDSIGGPRLGEDRDAVYPEGSFTLEDGEKLLLYSDGVTECLNAEGEQLGERRLLAAIGDEHKISLGPKDIVKRISKVLEGFRQGQELADDVSFMVLKWNRPQT